MRVEVTLQPRVVGGVEPEEERLLPRLNTDEASAAMTPPLTPLLGEYPKNSDNYPNTRGVLNTFKYAMRAQRV
jgi:hypothetical protein